VYCVTFLKYVYLNEYNKVKSKSRHGWFDVGVTDIIKVHTVI